MTNRKQGIRYSLYFYLLHITLVVIFSFSLLAPYIHISAHLPNTNSKDTIKHSEEFCPICIANINSTPFYTPSEEFQLVDGYSQPNLLQDNYLSKLENASFHSRSPPKQL